MVERGVNLDLSPSSVHTPSSGSSKYVGGYSIGSTPTALDVLELVFDRRLGGDKSPAALAVVTDTQGRILTVSRPASEAYEMSFPGGHVEKGETYATAAARELLEETGVTAGGLEPLFYTTSPTDGRVVRVFRATSWSGSPHAAEKDTKIAWLTPAELAAQAARYRPTVEKVMQSLGLFPGVTLIDASKRNALPEDKFALPATRKYPIDTPARTRNAAARLEQMRKKSKISDADYKAARGRIGAAAKRFGIESEYTTSDDRPAPASQGRRTIHVRADLAPGGALHVRHHMSDKTVVLDDGAVRIDTLASGVHRLYDSREYQQDEVEVDPAEAGVKLKGPAVWADGSPKKLVWVQLATPGSWKGHPAGAFEMTPATFAEAKRNFETRNIPIQWDMDHCSEEDATSGSIPEKGAPAQGWIHRLDNRGMAGLWGLTEWFDYARDGIKAGRFGFVSPAMRFGCRDQVSGKPIGARITSAAITNKPFLSNLEGLRAANDAGGANLGGSLIDRGVHASGHVMPRLKEALKLHALSSPQDVSDKLGQLRSACMTAGEDGAWCGENLHDYMQPLSDIVGKPFGSTYEDVLDALDEFVDAEIEKHVFQGVPMPDPPSATMNDAGQTTETDMSEAALKEANEKVTTLETEKRTLSDRASTAETKATTLETENATLNANLSETRAKNEKLDVAMREILAALAPEGGLRLLKDKETIAEAIVRIAGDNARLLKDKQDRDEADLRRDVETAYNDYKDSRRLSEKDRDGWMSTLARTDRAHFNETFVPLTATERKLLTTVVPPEERPSPEEEQTQSLSGLAREIMLKDPTLNFVDAREEAARQIRNGKKSSAA